MVHRGDRSAAVRTLQCLLNDDGYGPVAVDGWYGPQTRAAVTRVEDGFEGPSPHPGRINNGFWVLLLGQHLPDRTLRLGQHGSAVRRSSGPCGQPAAASPSTVRSGRRPSASVKAYQVAQGLPASGIVGERTRFFLAMGGVIGAQN